MLATVQIISKIFPLFESAPLTRYGFAQGLSPPAS